MSAPPLDVVWRPLSQPQYDFLAASEYEVFYGGAKGGAKSESLLMAALQQIHLPRYKALLLRRTFPELQELMDRSHRYFPRLQEGPAWDGNLKRWVWGNGDILQFGYCMQKEDVYRYHGGEWAFIGFDELADQADESCWTLLMAENRCPNPQVRLFMRGTGNPGKAGHAWCKRRFVDTCGLKGEHIYRYRLTLQDGHEHELTRRFIPAKVMDNPIYSNDRQYLAQLHALPEILRRQLLFGDWTAGTGAALDELDPGVHWQAPFTPPPTWFQWAGFDWGFAHPWVLIHAAADEDGHIHVLDTIRGRRHRPDEIAERIRDRVDTRSLRQILAGHDAFYETRARGENAPSIAEQFNDFGLSLSQANTARRFGLNTLRSYLAHRGLAHGPKLTFCKTPGNDWLFQQLLTIQLDPDDPEDALKVDADDVSGEGGDDGYDALRHLVCGRPLTPEAGGLRFNPWSKETLAREARERRTVKSQPLPGDEEDERADQLGLL